MNMPGDGVADCGPCNFSRIFAVLIALCLCLSAPFAWAESRTVKVGVYENAPKVFTSDSGYPSGIFIDIIEYIARQEGWTLRYVKGTWTEGLDRLAKGEIDLMPDVAYTAEREKIYSFHKVPVLSSWFQVYARKGSGIQSVLDLNGKRIAVLEGSVQQSAISELAEGFGLNISLVAAPDFMTVFEAVSKGDADAAISNNFFGQMNARKYNLEDTAVVFNPSSLFFAAPKNTDLKLLILIDMYLRELKKDPQSIYYHSLNRWTSEKVSFQLPAWLKILSLVLGASLLISLAGSAILKRQVNAQTRELRQINHEMERRIEERTAELAAAMEKARAADQIKSAFLATMSHELRTPLNSIIGFTGILLQGLAGPLNPEQHKQMTMVQNSARHLLSLINDVLDISKIEAGQLSLSYAPFDLKASIEKVVKLVSPLAKQKGLDLREEIADGIGMITSDQRRLEQVILNLLNNAVKFTEHGHVRIACRAENGNCVLSVSDTGIGIQQEDISGLFKPFHQIDTGLARKHEGTGLGLSICKKLMDMMGGSIHVESQLGQGSTFTVRFPTQAGGSQ